jgi:hypothetical protein
VTQLPQFVIIGAHKSASTALADTLRQHTQVYMPAGETHHFRDPEYRSSRLGDLALLFGDSHPAKRRGIKCPDYLGQEPCAQRIASDLGLVDIIAVLRNPIDGALSNYYWRMRWGQLPVTPPEVGLRKVLQGRYVGVPKIQEILEYGRYANHWERYLRIFGPERILILLDSDLRRDPVAAQARCYSFLGLDSGFRPRLDRKSGNEGVYPIPRIRLLRAVNRFVYDNGDPLTGTLRRPKRVDQVLFLGMVVQADRYVMRPVVGNEKPVIDPGLRRKLRDFYEADIRGLEKLIDRDLTAWLEG